MTMIERLSQQGCLRFCESGFLGYWERQSAYSPEGCLRYSDVPKDPNENLLWRAWLWQQMRDDASARRCIIASCRNDLLFYVNSFCYSPDTRKERTIQPFITYEYQDVFLSLLVYNSSESLKPENRYRRWDVGVDKSRDMGVTWCVMYFLDWVWRFRENRQMRCISSKKERVDNTGDADALFQKLDYLESRMPPSLAVRGNYHDADHGRPSMKVINDKYGNQIRGEASGKHAGRGGRNFVAFRDEEPAAECGREITRALNQTTRMQIRVGTPIGIGNSFYTAKKNGGIDWLTLHWSLHPEKAEGLYSIAGGRVEPIDREWHDAHPDYKFMTTPTSADPGAPWEFLRSPWFDGEERGADSLQDIAQEIQIAYLGSGSPFFRADKLAEARAQNARPPVHVGDAEDFIPDACLHGEEEILRWTDRDLRSDKLKLWFPLVNDMVPQNTSYTMGIDVASGNGGGSDSCISIADDTTKEKVMEYRSNGITPEDFAMLSVAVYRWFTTDVGAPFMAWDQGGPGGPFGTKVLSHGDLDVYYHKPRDERNPKPGRRPGIPSNRHIKKELFTDYREALFHGGFFTPSTESYRQAEQFVFDGRGGVIHQVSKTTDNMADTGDQHGDVTTSEVILVRAMLDRPEPMPVEHEPEYGTLAYRMREHALALLSVGDRWYQ